MAFDPHLVIFILAIIGVAEALYLNYECRRQRAPVCLIGDQCHVVWDSPYSKTFGVSNEILGLVFYTAIAAIEIDLVTGDTSSLMMIGEYLVLIGGTIMSFYFFYIQWRVIKAWCFWCTLSAVIVWLMLLARLAL